jgi:hypothetical protein
VFFSDLFLFEGHHWRLCFGRHHLRQKPSLTVKEIEVAVDDKVNITKTGDSEYYLQSNDITTRSLNHDLSPNEAESFGFQLMLDERRDDVTKDMELLVAFKMTHPGHSPYIRGQNWPYKFGSSSVPQQGLYRFDDSITWDAILTFSLSFAYL